MEQELGGSDGQRAAVRHGVAVGRMPVQNHIDIAKKSRADHVDLAVAALFGGRTVISQCPRHAIVRHVLFESHRCEGRSGSQKVMAAAMARPRGYQRITVGHGSLRETRQRVEFAENADDGLAFAIGGDEGGRLLRHACLDAEAGLLQIALQKSRALFFVVAQLRILPDRFGSLRILGAVLVDERFDLFVWRGLAGGG